MRVDESRYRQAERDLWAAVDASPTDHRLPLADLGCDVRVQEVGTGRPVLFLHGAPNAGSTWAEVVARLPDFRSLLVDRPGAGLSTPLPKPLDRETAPRFADRFAVDVLDALEIERAEVDVSELLNQVEPLISPQMASKRLAYACEQCEAGLTAMGDPERIQQILINLLTNAVDASLSNGAKPVRIGWRIAETDLVVGIEDSGMGIANAENLFVPFYTTKPKGSGVGLALAQQIARAHGGEIRLVNREDAPGARAIIHLPLS